MKDNVEIAPELIQAISQYASIAEKFITVQAKLSQINSALSNDRMWEGKRRDKCKKTNSLLQQYQKAIPPFCNDLEEAISDMLRNAESFNGDSTCLARIKNW